MDGADTRLEWPRLGSRMATRRHALGLTQEQAVGAAGGGVSAATWRKLEAGVPGNYTARTMYAIARALQWADDSIDLVLHGGEPVEVGDGVPPEIADRLRALEREVRELKEALTSRDLGPAEPS